MLRYALGASRRLSSQPSGLWQFSGAIRAMGFSSSSSSTSSCREEGAVHGASADANEPGEDSQASAAGQGAPATGARPLHRLLATSKSLSALEDLVKKAAGGDSTGDAHHPGLDSQAISAGMLRLWQKLDGGQSAERLRPCLELLLREVAASPSEMSARALSTSVHICTRMNLHQQADKVLEPVLRQLVTRADEFSPQDLANVAWCLAKAEVRSSDSSSSSSSGSGILNSSGGIQLSAIKALQEQAVRKASAFEPPHIAALLWAFATLQQPSPRAFSALGKRAAILMPRFQPRELSSTVWAFAKIRHSGSSSAVFRAAEERVLGDPSAFGEHELSNIAWAFGTRGCNSPELLDALVARALASPGKFKPAALGNIANAAAMAGRCPPEVLEVLEAEVLRRGRAFEPKALVTFAKAFAEARIDRPKALDALSKHIAAKMETMRPFHVVCTAASSFAALRRGSPKLFDGVHKALLHRAQNNAMRASDLASLVHSLACAGHLDVETMAQLRLRIQRMQEAREFTRADLCALFQAELLLNPGLEQDTEKHVLPKRTLRQAHKTWKRIASSGSSASPDQVAIRDLLEGMGVGCELEHRTKDGMFMLDIGIPDGLGSGSVAEGSAAFGSPIAVEVDGPRHFTCSRPYRELGPTVLRRKLLQARGWVVVNLPLHEWKPLEGSLERQRDWVADKFAAQGLVIGGDPRS